MPLTTVWSSDLIRRSDAGSVPHPYPKGRTIRIGLAGWPTTSGGGERAAVKVTWTRHCCALG